MFLCVGRTKTPKDQAVTLPRTGTSTSSARNGHSPAGVSAPVSPSADVQALAASEQRFRTLYETAPCSFLLLDALGVAIHANTYVRELMGYELEELVGRNMFSLVHPEDMPRTFEVFTEILQTP